jgi:hypothetical protein
VGERDHDTENQPTAWRKMFSTSKDSECHPSVYASPKNDLSTAELVNQHEFILQKHVFYQTHRNHRKNTKDVRMFKYKTRKHQKWPRNTRTAWPGLWSGSRW